MNIEDSRREGLHLLEASFVLYIAALVVITKEIWSKW